MSIQTELTRIIDAKAAIKAAIEGKGVTVPDGTLLDGMVEAINAIETGSGATDVTDSVVSVAFSSANALSTYTGFNGILPEDAKIAILIWQGDKSNAVNNQCLFAVLQRVYINSNNVILGAIMYCRWRNSSYDFQKSADDNYDLIVNAGDTFRMVVIK